MRIVRTQPTDCAARDVNGEVSLEGPSPEGTGRRKRPVTWIAWLTLGLILMTMSPPASAADRGLFDLPLIRGCAWPFISDVQTLNAFYPDTNATYRVAPYIALPGSQLIVQGTYPNGRFMSLNTYDRLGQSVGAIHDAAIEPDARDTNPFVDPAAGPGGHFKVTIIPPLDPPQPLSSNIIPGPPLGPPDYPLAAQGYVVYRVYVPDDPSQLDGGQPIPSLTVVHDGQTIQTVDPCTGTDNPTKVLALILLQQRLAEGDPPPNPDPAPETSFFLPEKATEGAFPNDFNVYLSAVITYQPGRIVVVRDKAPVAPDTRDGEPVTAPQDLRYWSLCNNTNEFPFPVVACKADFETALDGQGFYTYVVAAPEDLPANAATDPTVTVLPWGSKAVENALLLRNMLPSATFHQAAQDVKATPNCSSPTVPPAQAAVCAQGIMGAYYPTAFYCETHVYKAQGWQGCLPK
jgi:hypothetical protein